VTLLTTPSTPSPSAYRMSVTVTAATAEEMRQWARKVASRCEGGDVIVLTGDLGAGKTTFTQGLASGLGITDRVTSPTFVISRVHPHPGDGLGLVHVDAYRLGTVAELDDLDLYADLDASVTVVEWGRGLAERLSPHGLTIVITRSDADDDDERTLTLSARDDRWASILADHGWWAT
jgi:tRNA threonylcarbamoyladenosine biosynthesis protein TsaE